MMQWFYIVTLNTNEIRKYSYIDDEDTKEVDFDSMELDEHLDYQEVGVSASVLVSEDAEEAPEKSVSVRGVRDDRKGRGLFGLFK